jgi:hypothetical protein|nr:MAG TPA: protein of unknown function (DUF2087) [Caudoviricetes sp.]
MWKGEDMAKRNEASVLKFSKEQIVASKKYSPYKDFFNGNLKTGQMYSEAELNALITKNFKKGTGE